MGHGLIIAGIRKYLPECMQIQTAKRSIGLKKQHSANHTKFPHVEAKNEYEIVNQLYNKSEATTE